MEDGEQDGLARAHMLGGDEIFESDNPKYAQSLQSKLKKPGKL
jgi:hypothetical protein